mgnify:FL=1|tara:strand:+ start:843 stop:1064 length:222 start_codon:yes stop_codon:yes gene_type:complete
MNLSKYLIQNLSQERDLKAKSKGNYIELNNYFVYSGMQEINNRLRAITPKYREPKKNVFILNDMSKYKLKKYN